VIFVYDFKAILLMRAPTAVLLLSAIGSLACANRGMHAPDGGPGAAGAAGSAGRGGQGGTSARGGSGGTGGGPTGVAGTGGRGGTVGTGGSASCSIPADAGASGGACGAMFNFETDTEGAIINSGSSAFKSLAKSSAFTFCGSGALAITSQFSGMSGGTIKGEVLLPLAGAPIDVTGKTITVHVASDPGCSSDLNLSLVLNTQSGPMYFASTFPIRQVTNSWKTASVTVAADGGATTALNLSLQAFSTASYQGTIYIDEIDVK
jgi:hypothetical protein